MKRLVLFLIIVFIPGIILSQYHGNLTGNTTWGPGEVIVDGTVDLAGYTLTISPGTTIRLHENVKIYVPGASSIIADGEESNKITFEAFSTRWNHIDIYNSGGNVFDHCIFRDGSDSARFTTRRGGALLINRSGVTVTNCIFTNNIAYDGGAISIYQSATLIENCTFYRNIATRRGGALHIQADETDEVHIVSPTVRRCKIYSNSALETGGIHLANYTSATIENTLIYNNSATNDGGVTTNIFSGKNIGTVNVINCVLANNFPFDMYFRGSTRTSVQNSIIWGSDQSVYFLIEAPNSNNLINCAVQGARRYNTPGNLDIPGTFTSSFQLNSLNNASDGPNFISPLADYSITYISPCRDMGLASGAPATDFLGNTRIDQYDIGAYEVQRHLLSWTGGVNNDWGTAGNWTPVSVPSLADDVAIQNTGNNPVEITAPAQCYNLIVEPLARVTINASASLTVAGSLVVNSPATGSNGSIVNNGTVSGRIIYNRRIPDDGSTQLWHYISSPLNLDSLVTAKEFYPWNEVDGVWGTPTVNIGNGHGYTIIGGGIVSFIGTMNPSDLIVDATSPYADILTGTDYSTRTFVQGDGHSAATRSLEEYGGGGFNLLGNPFTSSLRIVDNDTDLTNDFLTVNQTQFDPNYVAVYLFNGNTYSFIGNSTGWEEEDPVQHSTTDVQTGQAFFVLAMNDYSTFSFTRAMQNHNTTVALVKSASSAKPWPGIRLKVKSGALISSALIVYNDYMTPGLDPGFDVGFISGGAEIEVYTLLPENIGSLSYTRQALPLSGIDSIVVPVGIESQEGGIIEFSASAVPIASYRYLLEDREMGIFVDISKRSYSAIISPQTSGAGRFYLHTSYAARKDNQERISSNENAEIQIWTSGNDLIIKGSLGPGSVCEIFNLQGQKILSVNLLNDELNTIETASFLKGVYLIKVTDGIKVYTRKIFVR